MSQNAFLIFNAVPPMWTLTEGLNLVRSLEQDKTIARLGVHFALGGGVLHKGFSNKDLDVIVIPVDARTFDRVSVLQALRKLLAPRTDEHRDHSKSTGDTKYVHAFWSNGRRIDFFFLS